MNIELAIYDAAMAYAEATANAMFETMRARPDVDTRADTDKAVSDTYKALVATLSSDTNHTIYRRSA